MTAPDRPVQDLIAEVLEREFGPFLAPPGPAKPFVFWHSQAAAVVAACREATLAQKAELTKGRVERQAFDAAERPLCVSDALVEDRTGRDAGWHFRTRLTTPWRPVDPS